MTGRGFGGRGAGEDHTLCGLYFLSAKLVLRGEGASAVALAFVPALGGSGGVRLSTREGDGR